MELLTGRIQNIFFKLKQALKPSKQRNGMTRLEYLKDCSIGMTDILENIGKKNQSGDAIIPVKDALNKCWVSEICKAGWNMRTPLSRMFSLPEVCSALLKENCLLFTVPPLDGYFENSGGERNIMVFKQTYLPGFPQICILFLRNVGNASNIFN